MDCLFGYTGQPFDTATGLQNNLNRWYDPAVGRWLSEDPSGLGPDVNPYLYGDNAPTDGTDPSGLDKVVNGASPDDAVPLIGPVSYLSQGTFWSDPYNAGTREGPIVLAPDGQPYFYADLETASKSNSNINSGQFDGIVAQAERRYQLTQKMAEGIRRR